MEKLIKHLAEGLKPVLLYYDDIEKIVELFNKISTEVKIEAEGYALANIEELRAFKKNLIHDLKVSISKPYVSLDLSGNKIWLYAAEDNPIEVGLFNQLKEYLHSKRRRLTPLTQNFSLAGATFGSSFWFLLLPLRGEKFSNYSILLALVLFIFGLFWSWWAFYASSKQHTIIYPLLNRNLGANFFQRNRDQLLTAGISAAVGSIITFLLTKLF